jgi:antitoxin YefM
MRTANFTDLRKNLRQYLDQVVEDSDKLIIPRSGGNGVIMMSLAEYNSIAETEYLMSSPAMMQAIREAEQELAEGRFITLNSHEDIDNLAKKIEAEYEAEELKAKSKAS